MIKIELLACSTYLHYRVPILIFILHRLYLLNGQGPGSACRGGHLSRGVSLNHFAQKYKLFHKHFQIFQVSSKEAGLIVALHNQVRARVARGEERRGRYFSQFYQDFIKKEGEAS